MNVIRDPLLNLVLQKEDVGAGPGHIAWMRENGAYGVGIGVAHRSCSKTKKIAMLGGCQPQCLAVGEARPLAYRRVDARRREARSMADVHGHDRHFLLVLVQRLRFISLH